MQLLVEVRKDGSMAKTLTEKFESERKECVTSEDFLRLINRWRNIQGAFAKKYSSRPKSTT